MGTARVAQAGLAVLRGKAPEQVIEHAGSIGQGHLQELSWC